MKTFTTRSVVTLVSVIVMIALLALVFATSFPWWLGLIIALVLLLPMQIYLNKSNPQRNNLRNDY
ncbi:hypothetical protein C3B44_00185 [Corynebacterium yudongzhengii]|uniref:Uncharacterized protein n=1 Tax=Corynebacterium yudongzhengii TaxID=2080740 RepID=A0A2U1T550_9CORY|nr:hypothetical protein [Corynebacterium yudongzhengii]AWB80961.1 hypothetical protein C3B44_00185 [Corynebacterium yudongzhengii]PWC01113.1 hypothetical protein DF222_09060 [Corynebacterium yudongzhengii]